MKIYSEKKSINIIIVSTTKKSIKMQSTFNMRHCENIRLKIKNCNILLFCFMCLSVISLYKYCIYITIYAYIIDFMLYSVYKIKVLHWYNSKWSEVAVHISCCFFYFYGRKVIVFYYNFFHLYDMQCLMDNCCNDIIPLKLLKMSEKEKKNIYMNTWSIYEW